jgi:hypothetical protein
LEGIVVGNLPMNDFWQIVPLKNAAWLQTLVDWFSAMPFWASAVPHSAELF